MRRVKKGLLILAALLLAAALGLFAYAHFYLESTLPPRSGAERVPGLSDRVEITFDARGIPQVWAATESDAYFALGWLHAGDRLFQMELTRRVANGRLAELFGEALLGTDRLQRAIGHHRLAAEQIDSLGARERKVLSAYVEGINTYVSEHPRLPFEFRLVGAPWEPWTLVDVMSIGLFQTWYLEDLLSTDELAIRADEKAGDAAARALLESYPTWAPTTLRENAPPPVETLARSSNAWAVAASKSASGESLMANDPHLDITTMPGFWYVAGLHAEDVGLDAVGITSPGSPSLVMGHSARIAWGMVAAGIDLRDYYLEEVDPENPERYRTPEGWAAFEKVVEKIAVKGSEEPEELVVRITRHGPLVPPWEGSELALAVRWVGFDASQADTWRSLLDLPLAEDWQAFRRSAGDVGSLNASWIYADAEGNAGYQLGSPVPRRPFAESRLALEGWNPDHDWQGYHPGEARPHVLNPERGWVANCNNQPGRGELEADLPGTFHFNRILRIEEILSSAEVLSAEDMIAAQLDRRDLYALRYRDAAVEELRRLGAEDDAAAVAEWDGTMAADSRPAALVNLWGERLRAGIFRDELGTTPSYRQLEAVFGDPSSPWWDDVTTERVETRGEILSRAMEETLAEAEGKTWGDLNSLTLRHAFAGLPILTAWLGLERGPIPRGGSWGTLDASFYFRSRSSGRLFTGPAPSWRRVVDFADVDGARMVLPAGQSGHPRSPHFMDFHELYQAGEYWVVPLSRRAVEERAVSTLILEPIEKP